MSTVRMLDRLRGNTALKRELSVALRAEHLPHSILLVGEEGCGAGFAARCLAADYLFPQGGPAAEDTAAGQLSRIVAGTDGNDGSVETGKVREALSVRPDGKSAKIKVSQIRTARSEIFKSSLSSDGRVILVQGAQAMNQEAANAFLKVLEEPPEGALFLLTASSLAGVLPTIRSRCAVYTVAPVSLAECAAAVREMIPGLSAPEAALLAQVYGGCIGRCLAAARPPRSQTLADARALCGCLAAGDEYGAMVRLLPVEKDKLAARLLLSDLSALAAASLRDPEFRFLADAPPLSPEHAAHLVDCVGRTWEKLDANGNGKLVLTLFAVEASVGEGRRK